MTTFDPAERVLLHSPQLESDIARCAAAQGGVVSRGQLLAIGVSGSAIGRRSELGSLHRVRPGVYAVGHPHLAREGRFWAALLAAGPGAALSHRTAAALWDLRPSARARIEVTVQGGGRRGDRGLQIHHVRSLSAKDVTRHQGLRVTTVARTLLDLADVVDHAALEQAFERALMLRRFDAHAMRDVLDRANGRRGVNHPYALLAQLDDTPPRTRSGLERQFLRFCAAHHLPTPRTNILIEGFEVDAHFPGTRLIVELDARSTHTTPRTFERDRERNRRLAVAGYTVVRVTDLQMTTDPDGLAADLLALLA